MSTSHVQCSHDCVACNGTDAGMYRNTLALFISCAINFCDIYGM